MQRSACHTDTRVLGGPGGRHVRILRDLDVYWQAFLSQSPATLPRQLCTPESPTALRKYEPPSTVLAALTVGRRRQPQQRMIR